MRNVLKGHRRPAGPRGLAGDAMFLLLPAAWCLGAVLLALPQTRALGAMLVMATILCLAVGRPLPAPAVSRNSVRRHPRYGRR